jgi:LmbE family N-acetylglucosaminyl deacetylase
MEKWIFLSPHFDDVVLSCGGLVWELGHSGNVIEIWTICAGDPPYDKPLTEYAQLLHGFLGVTEDVPFMRCQEDARCCAVLGVSMYRRFTIPDNIYRYFPGSIDPVIIENEDQMKPLEPGESYLIPQVVDFIRKNLPEQNGIENPSFQLVVPLAIGNHRDHVLTRKAAEKLGIPLWHYVDYPYILQSATNLSEWIPPQADQLSVDITEAGLKAWQEGFACHRSQLNLFWSDEEEMRSSIEKYHRIGYGNTLWKF